MSPYFYILPTILVIVAIRKCREYTWGRCKSKKSLRGKTFLVTGANSGIGFETAKSLALREARVIMGCRNLESAAAAIQKITACKSDCDVVALELDLSDFASIRNFASSVKTLYPNIYCLINNAGVATNETRVTKQHFEIHFGVNYLGHFLLTNLLMDNLRENRSKIIVVTSTLHEKGHIDIPNVMNKIVLDEAAFKEENVAKPNKTNLLYCDSKLANLYFAMELEDMGFETYAVCPGFTFTNIFRDYKLNWYQYILFSPIALLFLRTANQGAQTILHCATERIKPPTLLDSMNIKHSIKKGYLNRNCKFYKSKHRLNEELSKQLWQISLQLCELK